jgi:hypothetical protein
MGEGRGITNWSSRSKNKEKLELVENRTAYKRKEKKRRKKQKTLKM